MSSASPLAQETDGIKYSRIKLRGGERGTDRRLWEKLDLNFGTTDSSSTWLAEKQNMRQQQNVPL